MQKKVEKTLVSVLEILGFLTIMFAFVGCENRAKGEDVLKPKVTVNQSVKKEANETVAKESIKNIQVYVSRKVDSKTYKVCDISKCLGDYTAVRRAVFKRNRKYISLGKSPNSNQISFIEVSKKYNEIFCESNEKKYYCFGKLDFSSSPLDCDKELGKPIRQNEKERAYCYKNTYEIVFGFSGEKMKSMGVYLTSKEEALRKYIVGDFILQGCRIIEYKGNYHGKEIFLPEGAVSIAPEAFKIEKSKKKSAFNAYRYNQDGSLVKKITVIIPNDMFLEQRAFAKSGPIEVKFEEGRKEIEQGAFYNAGQRRTSTIVRLPSSIRCIRESAFDQFGLSSGKVNVTLNDGIKVIEKYALRNVIVEKLPDSIEEIGDRCLYIENPSAKLILPKNLKKLGDTFLVYGDGIKEGGVSIDKENKFFACDKKGWLYSKDKKVLYFAYSRSYQLNIPKFVEKINCELQITENCEKDDSIRFPNGQLAREYKEKYFSY